jgi:hypothetical protein
MLSIALTKKLLTKPHHKKYLLCGTHMENIVCNKSGCPLRMCVTRISFMAKIIQITYKFTRYQLLRAAL